MTMQSLNYQEVHRELYEATYLRPPLDGQDKSVHFGIDDKGREFVLIISAIDGSGKLGYLS